MIAYLKGKKIKEGVNFVIIDVNGVGYKVETSRGIGNNINDDIVEAFIYTHVREDSLRLFGFETEVELNLFEELLTVSGVGPKGALTILASADISDLITGIVNGEITKMKISGVGKKTLEKVVIELQTKMSKLEIDHGDKARTHARHIKATKNDAIVQANLALQSLGFKQSEIENVFDDVENLRDMNINEIIKVALKKMR